MKLSTSRSSILTAIVVATILAAVPGQIQRLLNTGEPYLFSHLFFEDMLARLSGPGRLRFIVQPAIAIFLGLRDGARDARGGSPPFLAALLSKRTHKRTLLLSALGSIRDLVAMAILVDVIYQCLIFSNIHPAAALLLGPMLIAVPYASSGAWRIDLHGREASGRQSRTRVKLRRSQGGANEGNCRMTARIVRTLPSMSARRKQT